MPRGCAKASGCRLQVSLSCVVLYQIVLLQYLSRSHLPRLAGLHCHHFLSCGLQAVTREVHRSYLNRLICSVQDHLIVLTLLIISMTFVLSLTQMLVLLSLSMMMSILLSMLVCVAASLFCVCLVNVQMDAPYDIVESKHELDNTFENWKQNVSLQADGNLLLKTGVWRMPPSLPSIFVVYFVLFLFLETTQT